MLTYLVSGDPLQFFQGRSPEQLRGSEGQGVNTGLLGSVSISW